MGVDRVANGFGGDDATLDKFMFTCPKLAGDATAPRKGARATPLNCVHGFALLLFSFQETA